MTLTANSNGYLLVCANEEREYTGELLLRIQAQEKPLKIVHGFKGPLDASRLEEIDLVTEAINTSDSRLLSSHQGTSIKAKVIKKIA